MQGSLKVKDKARLDRATETAKRTGKPPWDSLTQMGYRLCNFCGEVRQTRRRKRKNICESCYRRKRS